MAKIGFQEQNGVYIITPHGEMTFFFLEELDKFIKEKINNNQYKFVFNMEGVTWVDSMGLGVIAMTVKVALLNNSRVCIVKPVGNVVELLRLSSLFDIINIYDSIEKAIEFFD